jgi:hypothetical protein
MSAKGNQYNKAIAGADGATKDEKINSVVYSLKNRIYPDGFSNIVKSRQEWLKKSSKVNPWNPMTPANLATIGDKMKAWKNENSLNRSCLPSVPIP